jgi:hypothetical protein
MNRMLVLFSLLACAVVAQQPAASPPVALSQAETVDKIFEKWDSTVSPGCALSVIKAGQIIYKRGYGMADLDHDVPIRPDSVFHVASVSKQFTATAIVLLALTASSLWTTAFASTSLSFPISGRQSPSGTLSTTPAAFATNGNCWDSPAGATLST